MEKSNIYGEIVAEYITGVIPAIKDFSTVKITPLAGGGIHKRTALAAAALLFEYQQHWQLLDPKYTQKYFNQICPDYKLLGDVVTAKKHGVVTQRGVTFIKSIKQVREAWITLVYKDEFGYYDHGESQVVLMSEGPNEVIKRDLFEIIVNVGNMWNQFLYEKRLISPPPSNVYDLFRFRKRNECRSYVYLIYNTTINVYYDLTLRALFYNETTKEWATLEIKELYGEVSGRHLRIELGPEKYYPPFN